ncbi:hypothetical protein ETB97_008130 [Aspergillus alliaceus]|uniref:Uncharacterized protein n=1 Tax=Petromyces alliaceus TaxID=209559 RepID=A0A8H5ZY34_PETAA|nr:hypothetical protein ETB97_008130 [Aspergillus burnettii]
MAIQNQSLLPNEERKEKSSQISHIALKFPSPPSSGRTPISGDSLAAGRQNPGYSKVTSSLHETSKVPRKSIPSKLHGYWVLEIASCCGSLCALIGIVVLLWMYNGKKLPDWKWGIAISSALSWLVQAITALLLQPIAACLNQARRIYLNKCKHLLLVISLYDLASRGPLASLLLLWQTDIGTGPLVQQMAKVESKLVPSAEPASIA